MILLPDHPSVKAYKAPPLTFAEDGHTYTLNGKMVPSVTTISGMLDKPWLAAWKVKMVAEYISANLKDMSKKDEVIALAKKESNKRRDAAADTGKAVHKWIEEHISGNETPKPEDEGRIAQFLEWEQAHKPVYIMSEEWIASVKYEYAGTLDILAEVKGRVGVLDIKTGNSVPDEVSLQLIGGYMMALHECGAKTDFAGVIHIPAKKLMAYRELEEPAELCERAFLGLRETQKWRSYTEARKGGR